MKFQESVALLYKKWKSQLRATRGARFMVTPISAQKGHVPSFFVHRIGTQPHRKEHTHTLLNSGVSNDPAKSTHSKMAFPSRPFCPCSKQQIQACIGIHTQDGCKIKSGTWEKWPLPLRPGPRDGGSGGRSPPAAGGEKILAFLTSNTTT